jgi:hypothetical protein
MTAKVEGLTDALRSEFQGRLDAIEAKQAAAVRRDKPCASESQSDVESESKSRGAKKSKTTDIGISPFFTISNRHIVVD